MAKRRKPEGRRGAGAAPVRPRQIREAPPPRRGALAAATAIGLAVLTVFVYAPVRHFGFIDLDDPGYVYDNPHVTAGLTWDGIVWAFTTGYAANWHPLTWVSHMLDVELFGLTAGGHHITSVGLHVVAAMLLFGLLMRLTGALGRSAFVAGLFALHPLHVESVAWIAERKDVLSTVFWFLTTWAYVAHVAPSRSGFMRGSGGALLVGVVYALGLLSKPMLVTLPFTLLLLDFWPLNRVADPWRSRSWWPLVREKLPLVALAVVSSVVTLVVQQQGGAVSTLSAAPWALRVSNAVLSYAVYLRKTIWPADLALFYPYAMRVAPMRVLLAALVLAAVTWMAVRLIRRAPYVPVGWFWYLGTLVPVIGLVQVGTQGMADRYTYVPLIGIFIAVAWGLVDLLGARARPILAVAGIATVAAAGIAARSQVHHWRDSLSAWQHAVDVTQGNYRAHNSLGAVLGNQGRRSDAIRHFEEALRLGPDGSEAHHIHHNLGRALAESGRTDEAIAHYREALRIKPEFAEAHNNLGLALVRLGRVDEALPHYREAVRIDPDLAVAQNNLGLALYGLGRVDEAIVRYSDAIRLDPRYADAYNNRGFAYASRGSADAAIADFSAAVRARPSFEQARFNLALALASAGRFSEARDQLQAVLQQHPNNDLARRAVDYVSQQERLRAGRGGGGSR